MTPQPCVEPRQPADTRYVFCTRRTWHAPIAQAGVRLRLVDVTTVADAEPLDIAVEEPCCPGCGGPLLQVESREAYLRLCASLFDVAPEMELAVTWAGACERCYPNLGELERAFLMAMEAEAA